MIDCSFRIRNVLFLLVLTFAAMQECQCCFPPNSYTYHSLVSNSPFYQECHCGDIEGELETMKWVDPNGDEIKGFGPGTNSNAYSVKFERSIKLHVKMFGKNMTGVYKCIAIHNGKEYIHEYSINAYVPLYFVNTDETQFIVKGEDSKIKCEPRGESQLLVRWFKDDGPLQEINSKYSLEDNALVVKNVEDSDAGVYKCVARVLDTGEEVDKYIKTEVITLPEIDEIIKTSNNIICVGDFLKIECKASGIPEPTFSWTKVKKENTKKENKTWYHEGNTIIFEKIEADDRGAYVCTASNKAGQSIREVPIEVCIPPKIVDFSNVTAVLGTETKLVCKATGRPAPKLTITLPKNITNENSIPNASHSVVEEPGDTFTSVLTYTFPILNRSHHGRYTCIAGNSIDDAINKTSYLSVIYKPIFETTEEIVYGWNGNTVNLSCSHDSNPQGTIIWRFNKNQIKDDHSDRTLFDSFGQQYLSVLLENKTVYGTYECFARNALGEAFKVIKLVEAFPPPPIISVTLRKVAATTVTFDIYGPEIKPPVIGYTTEYDETESYNYTNIHRNRTWAVDRLFKVVGLRPGTEYQFKFAAINQVGIGVWSGWVQLNTSHKSVPEPPAWKEDIYSGEGSEVAAVKSDSYHLSWKTPEYSGDPIDYYTVRYCPIQENSSVSQEECIEERVISSTSTELRDLSPNTTYHVELSAHNSMGHSLPVEMYFTTSVKEDKPVLSAGAVIGLVVLVVILCLLAADLLLFFWKRQGIIASICCKKTKKSNQLAQQERDKKGLLKDGSLAQTEDTLRKGDNNGHKQFEYNKSTGVITGKHSAV